jgi:hypothetical protein
MSRRIEERTEPQMSAWLFATARSNGCASVFVQLGRLFAALLLAHSTVVVADSRSPNGSDSGAYRRAVESGLAAFNERRFEAARAQFSSAHAMRPSARTLRALGMTDFATDDFSQARRELEAALTDPAEPLDDAQRHEVQELLDWMHTSLASVRLRVTPARAAVRIDDKVVAAGEALLARGTHRLRVSATRYKAHDQVFEVFDPSQPVQLNLHLLPIEPQRESSSLAWWIGGASIALVASGGVLFGLGRSEIAKVEQAAPPYRSPSTGEDERDRGRLWTGLGIGVGAAGLAGLTTAIILSMSQDDGEREPVSWCCDLSPAGFSVRGSF